MSRKPILFYGDPHKNWGPLYDACAIYSQPGHIIVVGDLELERPLHREISDVFDAGWSVHYILGNHDTHGCPQYMHLVDDHPSGHLGGKVTPVGDFQVAGLSGVFKDRIWRPPNDQRYQDRRASQPPGPRSPLNASEIGAERSHAEACDLGQPPRSAVAAMVISTSGDQVL